jgi:Maltokinase N-terminal cap domain
MALFHRATITPSKAELVTGWAATQPWGTSDATDMTVIGSYRFDDPNGQVGMEAFLIQAGDVVLHAPLTYRDAPLDEQTAAKVGELHHSVLGTRHVYDGLTDPVFTTMLAGATMTGQGEALGMVQIEDRWVIAPSAVRITGGGWGAERIAVDGFSLESSGDVPTQLTNDHLRITVWRRAEPLSSGSTRPPICLTATWHEGPTVLIAQVSRK